MLKTYVANLKVLLLHVTLRMVQQFFESLLNCIKYAESFYPSYGGFNLVCVCTDFIYNHTALVE